MEFDQARGLPGNLRVTRVNQILNGCVTLSGDDTMLN